MEEMIEDHHRGMTVGLEIGMMTEDHHLEISEMMTEVLPGIDLIEVPEIEMTGIGIILHQEEVPPTRLVPWR